MAAPPTPIDVDHPLLIECYDDPVLVAAGLPATGVYFERFWLPLVGPSVAALLRHIEWHDGDTVSIRQIGEGLGLKAEHMGRCVLRAERFALVARSRSRLLGQRYVAPLTARQVAKLPVWLAEQHPASPPMRRIAATSSAR